MHCSELLAATEPGTCNLSVMYSTTWSCLIKNACETDRVGNVCSAFSDGIQFTAVITDMNRKLSIWPVSPPSNQLFNLSLFISAAAMCWFDRNGYTHTHLKAHLWTMAAQYLMSLWMFRWMIICDGSDWPIAQIKSYNWVEILIYCEAQFLPKWLE